MFVVRQPASSSEFNEGVSHLAKIFQDRFKTYPRELPDNFFLAFDTARNNEVVGTINVQLGKHYTSLEVEYFFEFDVEHVLKVPREAVAEIGRLTSSAEAVTPYLFCAATLFALRQGVSHFVSFNKRLISRCMKAHKLPVVEEIFPMRLDNVPEEYLPYFCENPREPIVVLSQEIKVWIPRVLELMGAGEEKVSIELPPTPTGGNGPETHPLRRAS